MADDLFDDDLFAVRPAPAPSPPPRRSRKPVDPAASGVASFACRCGARDEVKEPAPAALDCWNCHGLETAVRIVPRFTPPTGAGRDLTALEREGMALDR